MSHYLGIDIGASTVKVVLLDAKRQSLDRALGPAGYGAQDVACRLVETILTRQSIRRGDISFAVVTGYGRVRFTEADAEVSEISCHARAVHHLCHDARTVMDIGGQDSKVIRLTSSGTVADFAMNDKCAAGTGRFLEVMAAALGVTVEDLGGISQRSNAPVTMSSTCTVFAESEVISQISQGASRENIAAGLHQAIAARVLGLAGRVGVSSPILLTGGVAHNSGVVSALENQAGMPIIVPSFPQFAGALGAALFAADRVRAEFVESKGKDHGSESGSQ